MKLAIDCRMINNSGIGNVLKCILRYLPDEWNYLFIGNSDELKQYIHNNVEILDCRIPIFSKSELFKFPVKQVNDCDLFFSPNYNLPIGIKIPIFSMIHDVVFLDIPKLTSKIGYLIRYFYLMRAVVISKKIFTVSQFSMNRIIHYFGNKKKISYIYNSIPFYLKENLNKYQEKKIGKYFLYVGNVKPHKGIDVLIDAFKKLNNPEYDLIIVGKKDSFKTSLNNFDENNAHIKFTGFVSDEELYSYMNNARALIQPSRYEGFGIPPLEALYLKTPVILSNIPVFKELFSTFPVSFFENENSEDLCLKIKDIIEKNKYNYVEKSELDGIFNYETNIKILINSIKELV